MTYYNHCITVTIMMTDIQYTLYNEYTTTPFPENTKPKKVTEDLLNSHFFRFSVRFALENF